MRINHLSQNQNLDSWVFVAVTIKGLEVLIDKDGLAVNMKQEIEPFRGDESAAIKEAERRRALNVKRCRLNLQTVAYLKVNFKGTKEDDLIRRIDRIE